MENLSNPRDICTIRVSCGIVRSAPKIVGGGSGGAAAAAAAMGRKTFKVVLDGLEVTSQPLMDYGEIYCDRLYHDRSFAIYNTSETTHDFSLSRTQNGSSATEIEFSLSHTSPKLFRTVRIAPGQRVRVFIFLVPRSKTTFSSVATLATSLTERLAEEVYVSSRLLKDYRVTIKITGIFILFYFILVCFVHHNNTIDLLLGGVVKV